MSNFFNIILRLDPPFISNSLRCLCMQGQSLTIMRKRGGGGGVKSNFEYTMGRKVNLFSRVLYSQNHVTRLCVPGRISLILV